MTDEEQGREQPASGVESEPPEAILRRAFTALHEQDVERTRLLLGHLEVTAPELAGIPDLRQQLSAFEDRSRRDTGIRATEEMLLGYIQKRKKALAHLALDTLLELAPDHPRRAEYEIWINDLDQEVVLQDRIQQHLEEGRAALQMGHMDEAANHVEALKRLAPDSPATLGLAEELAQTRRDHTESEDIDRLKKGLTRALESGELDTAHQIIHRLSQLDVPKITLDFLRQGLAARQDELRQRAEMEQFDEIFNQRLQSHDWVGAREVADMFSERFPNSEHAAEMYDRVNALDAADRREQSKQQGIAALERFIEAGQRREAELALQVLRNLDVDPQLLAALEKRVTEL